MPDQISGIVSATQLLLGVDAVAQLKFFDERTDQSEVKARIIQKYFFAWANVVKSTAKVMGNKVAYIDLYAGPGRYRDGAASTPLLILEKVIADPELAKMFVALFNDVDANHTETLKSEIEKLPGIKNLTYAPQILCGAVGEDAERYFTETRLVPSFSFVDPFGYKGLSLKIINGVIKDWGCDCVFFFNYTRINAVITNPIVEQHIDALFGQTRAAELRKVLPLKKPHEREELILENIAQAIKEMGGEYVLPFRFKNSSGTRTSHSLVFVSKHFKGYEIMKEIMAKESSVADQGVPSLTYSPADESMPLLFSLSRPLDALEGMLVDMFAGQTLSMIDIYKAHNVDTPYIRRNYKDALGRLEIAGKITAEKHRPNTFADRIIVTFPARKE
jgi:three-Cys-motif partner protein